MLVISFVTMDEFAGQSAQNIGGVGVKNAFQYMLDYGWYFKISRILPAAKGKPGWGKSSERSWRVGIIPAYQDTANSIVAGNPAKYDSRLAGTYDQSVAVVEVIGYISNIFLRFSVWVKDRPVVDALVDIKYVMGTTEAFKSLSTEKRRCLFPDEKVLEHFPSYSEGNCLLECTWKFAEETCGCVPWFLRSK